MYGAGIKVVAGSTVLGASALSGRAILAVVSPGVALVTVFGAALLLTGVVCAALVSRVGLRTGGWGSEKVHGRGGV